MNTNFILIPYSFECCKLLPFLIFISINFDFSKFKVWNLGSLGSVTLGVLSRFLKKKKEESCYWFQPSHKSIRI